MAVDVMSVLGLSGQETPTLPGRLRQRLVRFLLRWQYYEALSGCLVHLISARPELVSLYDVRAQVLLEQGALEHALDVVQARHHPRVSSTSRALEARVHLARGDTGTALGLAAWLVAEAADRPSPWALLGEVQMAAGNVEAAVAAYRRLAELKPECRPYFWGMVQVSRVREDWVTASAYAVRLQESGSDTDSVPVRYLRHLRAYFQASGERNRVADVDEELASRHSNELDGLRETISLESGRAARAEGAPLRSDAPIASLVAVPEEDRLVGSLEPELASAQERVALGKAARSHFGFDSLWPGQAEIMASTLRGEDVLAVLPTGGGKSLCYQLPALLAESGTTLVVSPLVALMKDQVDKLPAAARAQVTHINYLLDGRELGRRLRRIRAGRYRLVYAAPERLRRPPFLHALRRAGVNRLVIDEAHCVSMWGHDFRPDYMCIAEARRTLGDPPLLAMTATAAPRVRRDILQRLGNMRIVAGDVVRPNLRLEVFQAHNQDEKLSCLLSVCKHETGSGIVYAGTRARCETLAELLRCQGVSAIHYHAGMENRDKAQDEFMEGRARVAVATVAFGMGIDKSDIRFIVHFVLPGALEEYYQEAGRAGRDGLPARCLLMYAPSDRAVLTRRRRQGQLQEGFLWDTYAAVKRNLGRAARGRVSVDDLRRDLQVEETPVRVAIHMLEQVGLLKRSVDMPRTATLVLRSKPPFADSDLDSLVAAARLRPGQPVDRDLLDVADLAEVDPAGLEERILAWCDEGYLEYRASARDPLLQLLEPSADVGQRLRTLLEQHDQVQRQRVAEIVAYAKTRRCRHGHISAYLGGTAVEKCTSCDNCAPEEPSAISVDLPDESDQLQTILLAAQGGWGERNLIRILRGRSEMPEKAKAGAQCGALAYRSGTAIRALVSRLVEAGLLRRRRLDHGGVMLVVTSAGRRGLRDLSVLRRLAPDDVGSPASEGRTTARATADDQPFDGASVAEDDPLLQLLNEWRLARAREEGVAPFRVAHVSLLGCIAAARPRTEAALLAIKGMSPGKLRRYGAELLRLVSEHARS